MRRKKDILLNNDVSSSKVSLLLEEKGGDEVKGEASVYCIAETTILLPIGPALRVAVARIS